jgi:hypothetical protein
MSKNVRNNLHFLKVLKDVNKHSRQVILRNANRNLINSINECVYNVLHNKQFKLKKNKRAKLLKYRSSLRKLVHIKTPFRKKKKIIEQQGGNFLPIILPTVLSLISSIFTQ